MKDVFLLLRRRGFTISACMSMVVVKSCCRRSRRCDAITHRTVFTAFRQGFNPAGHKKYERLDITNQRKHATVTYRIPLHPPEKVRYSITPTRYQKYVGFRRLRAYIRNFGVWKLPETRSQKGTDIAIGDACPMKEYVTKIKIDADLRWSTICIIRGYESLEYTCG